MLQFMDSGRQIILCAPPELHRPIAPPNPDRSTPDVTKNAICRFPWRRRSSRRSLKDRKTPIVWKPPLPMPPSQTVTEQSPREHCDQHTLSVREDAPFYTLPNPNRSTPDATKNVIFKFPCRRRHSSRRSLEDRKTPIAWSPPLPTTIPRPPSQTVTEQSPREHYHRHTLRGEEDGAGRKGRRGDRQRPSP